jgi:hypothetical protein
MRLPALMWVLFLPLHYPASTGEPASPRSVALPMQQWPEAFESQKTCESFRFSLTDDPVVGTRFRLGRCIRDPGRDSHEQH